MILAASLLVCLWCAASFQDRLLRLIFGVAVAVVAYEMGAR